MPNSHLSDIQPNSYLDLPFLVAILFGILTKIFHILNNTVAILGASPANTFVKIYIFLNLKMQLIFYIGKIF
jgi:ABC-type spermidine/putrescine transport system permease subunit I